MTQISPGGVQISGETRQNGEICLSFLAEVPPLETPAGGRVARLTCDI